MVAAALPLRAVPGGSRISSARAVGGIPLRAPVLILILDLFVFIFVMFKRIVHITISFPCLTVFLLCGNCVKKM